MVGIAEESFVLGAEEMSDDVGKMESEFQGKKKEKFQMRIQCGNQDRKQRKKKSEDDSSQEPKEKRPRGRPRKIRSPEELEKKATVKKRKTLILDANGEWIKRPRTYNKERVLQREKIRRDHANYSIDMMRRIIPGIESRLDKASVIECASQYVLFLKQQVGIQFDQEFLKEVF